MSLSNDSERCTCDVRAPCYEYAVGRSISGYAIRLSQINDDTRFDPACPFHGVGGSMVAALPGTEPSA